MEKAFEFSGGKYKDRSLVPSFYCYNRVNEVQPQTRPALFEHLENGTYRCLGPDDATYDGDILWKEKGSGVEKIVGKCTAGERKLFAQEPGKPVVLVVEEINRGNCAQIFGDIFQLLDRDESGYSTYPISADVDLAKWLSKEDQFGEGLEGIDRPGCIRVEDWNDILAGRKLALPPNLYIWATMNTSDQSLFPIDSAFKRRWDWEYVPILEGKDKDTKTPLGWKIVVGADAAKKEYDWWSFVGKINDVIDELTSSEDKKLGYFFVKPKDKTIDQKLLVNKVFFYLWNDVFKDMVGDPALQVQINGKGHDLKFHDFFKKDDGDINVDMIKAFMDKLKVEPPAGNQQGGTAPQATETTVTE